VARSRAARLTPAQAVESDAPAASLQCASGIARRLIST
jgi:hypothetical protein